MRIISKGTDPGTKPQYATCNHCRTQIEFMPYEAKRHSDQRDGDAYEIQCPTCHRPIWSAIYRGYVGPG